MKSPNRLYTDLDCPNCHATVDIAIELNFGVVDQTAYCLGDRYAWLPEQPVENGGRPENGNLDAEVGEVCPRCGSEFAVTVEIRNDIITRIIHSFPAKPAAEIERRGSRPKIQPGKIHRSEQWERSERREAALLRLAELGVDIYSVGGDDFTLMIPDGLPVDYYIDIGYLIAQLGDGDFPAGYEGVTIKQIPAHIFQERILEDPPVYFVDGYPNGLKYRVQPSEKKRPGKGHLK